MKTCDCGGSVELCLVSSSLDSVCTSSISDWTSLVLVLISSATGTEGVVLFSAFDVSVDGESHFLLLSVHVSPSPLTSGSYDSEKRKNYKYLYKTETFSFKRTYLRRFKMFKHFCTQCFPIMLSH